ncbi:MAG: type I-C CRISPR-associated protein Cas8c/Csd1, partial [Deltaproteobacteria bacterium]|nr:type I-C CRISPR-associated protein Cas8c/Csd1 [Deltaproteobacteria bacterium]
MILSKLDDYYNRLVIDASQGIPNQGFSRQKIHFSLVIDEKGNLVQLYDLRKNDKSRGPMELIVPEGENRSANIAPNYLWDNTAYVLGIDKKGVHKRSLEMFEAFRKRHHLLGDSIDDEGMRALLVFLDSWKPEKAEDQYGELLRDSDDIWGLNVVFKLDGEKTFLHEREKIRAAWEASLHSMNADYVATCALGNKKEAIARLHPKIKGVRGAQTSGASLVSFNLDAFTSYGKKQSYNAPISERAAFSYTTALNHLLRFESRQKLQIGDSAVLFWTKRKSPVEWLIPGILGSSDDMETDAEEGKHMREV